MSGHTPEPWEPGDVMVMSMAHAFIYDSDRTAIARVDSRFSEDGMSMRDAEKNCEANAHRIAACVNACAGIDDPLTAIPDLLAACKRAEHLVRLLTVGQVFGAGDSAVDASGLHPYALNEGRALSSDSLSTYWLSAAIARAEAGGA